MFKPNAMKRILILPFIQTDLTRFLPSSYFSTTSQPSRLILRIQLYIDCNRWSKYNTVHTSQSSQTFEQNKLCSQSKPFYYVQYIIKVGRQLIYSWLGSVCWWLRSRAESSSKASNTLEFALSRRNIFLSSAYKMPIQTLVSSIF
jgi:hypothetical protein